MKENLWYDTWKEERTFCPKCKKPALVGYKHKCVDNKLKVMPEPKSWPL